MCSEDSVSVFAEPDDTDVPLPACGAVVSVPVSANSCIAECGETTQADSGDGESEMKDAGKVVEDECAGYAVPDECDDEPVICCEPTCPAAEADECDDEPVICCEPTCPAAEADECDDEPVICCEPACPAAEADECEAVCGTAVGETSSLDDMKTDDTATEVELGSQAANNSPASVIVDDALCGQADGARDGDSETKDDEKVTTCEDTVDVEPDKADDEPSSCEEASVAVAVSEDYKRAVCSDAEADRSADTAATATGLQSHTADVDIGECADRNVDSGMNQGGLSGAVDEGCAAEDQDEMKSSSDDVY